MGQSQGVGLRNFVSNCINSSTPSIQDNNGFIFLSEFEDQYSAVWYDIEE